MIHSPISFVAKSVLCSPSSFQCTLNNIWGHSDIFYHKTWQCVIYYWCPTEFASSHVVDWIIATYNYWHVLHLITEIFIGDANCQIANDWCEQSYINDNGTWNKGLESCLTFVDLYIKLMFVQTCTLSKKETMTTKVTNITHSLSRQSPSIRAYKLIKTGQVKLKQIYKRLIAMQFR